MAFVTDIRIEDNAAAAPATSQVTAQRLGATLRGDTRSIFISESAKLDSMTIMSKWLVGRLRHSLCINLVVLMTSMQERLFVIVAMMVVLMALH